MHFNSSKSLVALAVLLLSCKAPLSKPKMAAQSASYVGACLMNSSSKVDGKTVASGAACQDYYGISADTVKSLCEAMNTPIGDGGAVSAQSHNSFVQTPCSREGLAFGCKTKFGAGYFIEWKYAQRVGDQIYSQDENSTCLSGQEKVPASQAAGPAGTNKTTSATTDNKSGRKNPELQSLNFYSACYSTFGMSSGSAHCSEFYVTDTELNAPGIQILSTDVAGCDKSKLTSSGHCPNTSDGKACFEKYVTLGKALSFEYAPGEKEFSCSGKESKWLTVDSL